jgi:hypothetical protein
MVGRLRTALRRHRTRARQRKLAIPSDKQQHARRAPAAAPRRRQAQETCRDRSIPSEQPNRARGTLCSANPQPGTGSPRRIPSPNRAGTGTPVHGVRPWSVERSRRTRCDEYLCSALLLCAAAQRLATTACAGATVDDLAWAVVHDRK